MTPTAKQAFAKRLVEAMLDKGLRSARNSAAGVDVAPLAKVAKVSREMGRRYVTGEAMPDPNKMAPIAQWLDVRVPWLRDGELPKHGAAMVAEPGAAYLTDDQREILNIWSKLPPARRDAFRDLMSLEAMVATHYPWLMFGRPKSETYAQYESRVERDILRLAATLQKK